VVEQIQTSRLVWRQAIQGSGEANMKREEIFDILKQNIIEVIDGLDPATIRGDMHLLYDLCSDSLESVEIIARTVNHLQVKVSRIELMRLRDINEMVESLYAALERQPQPA
jgi:acyl carrier protein